MPVIDTPLRTNADAAEVIVIPSLVALTGTLPVPDRTFGLLPDDGPVPAPPDPGPGQPGDHQDAGAGGQESGEIAIGANSREQAGRSSLDCAYGVS